MSDFTKKAIRDSFVKLLNEKPLSQITVRDIVDDCGVNRNTFYYHYQDLPQLLESIVEDDLRRVMRDYLTVDSMEECIDAVIGFALENRKAVMHIYHSGKREIYEKYQWKICEHIVTIYVDGMLAGREVPEQDRKLVIDYLKCVCFGLVTGWMEGGMRSDIQTDFHRICELRKDEIMGMILGREK